MKLFILRFSPYMFMCRIVRRFNHTKCMVRITRHTCTSHQIHVSYFITKVHAMITRHIMYITPNTCYDHTNMHVHHLRQVHVHHTRILCTSHQIHVMITRHIMLLSTRQVHVHHTRILCQYIYNSVLVVQNVIL